MKYKVFNRESKNILAPAYYYLNKAILVYQENELVKFYPNKHNIKFLILQMY